MKRTIYSLMTATIALALVAQAHAQLGRRSRSDDANSSRFLNSDFFKGSTDRQESSSRPETPDRQEPPQRQETRSQPAPEVDRSGPPPRTAAGGRPVYSTQKQEPARDSRLEIQRWLESRRGETRSDAPSAPPPSSTRERPDQQAGSPPRDRNDGRGDGDRGRHSADRSGTSDSWQRHGDRDRDGRGDWTGGRVYFGSREWVDQQSTFDRRRADYRRDHDWRHGHRDHNWRSRDHWFWSFSFGSPFYYTSPFYCYYPHYVPYSYYYFYPYEYSEVYTTPYVYERPVESRYTELGASWAIGLRRGEYDWNDFIEYLRNYIVTAPASLREDFRQGFVSAYGADGAIAYYNSYQWALRPPTGYPPPPPPNL